MLRIGYVRLANQDGGSAPDVLRGLGCQVIRAEDDAAHPSVLSSILEFIGPGDQLVIPNLQHLGGSARDVLAVIDRLDRHGAVLMTAEPALTTTGAEGERLRAVLHAVAALQPETPARRRTRAPADEIHALVREGLGPVAIARRLGVSRMTVWRKLKGTPAAACGA